MDSYCVIDIHWSLGKNGTPDRSKMIHLLTICKVGLLEERRLLRCPPNSDSKGSWFIRLVQTYFWLNDERQPNLSHYQMPILLGLLPLKWVDPAYKLTTLWHCYHHVTCIKIRIFYYFWNVIIILFYFILFYFLNNYITD